MLAKSVVISGCDGCPCFKVIIYFVWNPSFMGHAVQGIANKAHKIYKAFFIHCEIPVSKEERYLGNVSLFITHVT